ncbi:uncharacterized protein BDZ99DRAFT_476161 [Mytilinidion resinicola]|uniref:Uncharacterized protein n=1 Tax=Mytilinidion resinicola TaxID=574789 RepID=A0A6A6YMF6_9PEZI|nr:uncharacterized protein BDZ99DRAFT_476161 [Mytilinidion resinicola]KAF2809931.1 hypothetical protein BDZ99DRAFT_476161 [Mytilinidion resinicola]
MVVSSQLSDGRGWNGPVAPCPEQCTRKACVDSSGRLPIGLPPRWLSFSPSSFAWRAFCICAHLCRRDTQQTCRKPVRLLDAVPLPHTSQQQPPTQLHLPGIRLSQQRYLSPSTTAVPEPPTPAGGQTGDR